MLGCGMGIICNKIDVFVVMCDWCDFDNLMMNCGFVVGYYVLIFLIVVLRICVMDYEEIFKN